MAVGGLAAVLARADWSALGGLGSRHAWALLAIASLMQLMTIPCKAAGWQIMIGAVDPYGPPPPRTVLAPVAVGGLLNTLLPGRVGDAARVMMVHARLRRAGRPVGVSVVAGSAVTETIVSTAAWVVLVAVAGLVLPLPTGVWMVMAGATAVLALIAWIAVRTGEIRPAGGGSGPVVRIRRAARRGWAVVADGHRALGRVEILFPLVGVSIAGWLAQLAGVWAVLVAFDVDGGWQIALLVLVSVSVAQTLPLVPGNVGVYQVAASVPLIAAGGLTPTTAVAVGVVLQLTQTAPIALAGALVTLRQGEDLGDIWRMARGRAVEPAR